MINKKCRFTVRILFCLLLLQFLGSISHSKILNEEGITQKESIGSRGGKADWSQYRGPNRDGVAVSDMSIKAWPSGSPPFQVWKKPIGEGFSGIVITGDFLITAIAEEDTEFLVSFEKTTGKEIWRTPLGKMFVEEMGNGPRATPTLDGDFAYILNSYGGLFCARIKSGEQIWTVSLPDTFNIQRPLRGFSTCPLILDEILIIHGGGEDSAFIGLDKKTGKTIWQTGDSTAGHSSPFTAVINGVEQCVFTVARQVEENGEKKILEEAVSVSADGKILWRGPSLPQIIAMPVFVPPNKVFISSSVENGCLLIQVLPDGKVETVWQNTEMRNHFNSSVYYKDHIYGFSSSTLKCLVAETAQRKWSTRGYGKGSLIIADEKLIVLSDRGMLALIEATPKGYKELARAQVIEGKSWTSPTIENGIIYMRNQKEMACYDLTK
ncbi:MAG: PQQ-like beta-propeller repeat protein [Candidatus Aminicenantes bacterium]|nr:PQQ-like beta-propeller repeat protein [Candidatus Aminicenantes bacterium]